MDGASHLSAASFLPFCTKEDECEGITYRSIHTGSSFLQRFSDTSVVYRCRETKRERNSSLEDVCRHSSDHLGRAIGTCEQHVMSTVFQAIFEKIAVLIGSIAVSLGIMSTPANISPNQLATTGMAEKPSLAPSPTIILKTKNIIVASPSATPTPSEALLNTCRQLSNRTEYFTGLNCYPVEYDQYIKDNNISIEEGVGGDIGKRQVEISLLHQSSGKNTVDLMVNNCVKIGAEMFKKCNDSLTANAERIKYQILERTHSDRQECLSKIDSGDTTKIDKTNDYYWRAKLKEKMEDLYSQCIQNNGSLDGYK